MSNSTSQTRPPVIVVMGHIDHGKSTLLDYIRQSNVVATEAGGITQHTSAYEVEHKLPDGTTKKITFIDTPGHAAFSAMRSRGAKVADIAILIVSAEEGVKTQTLEALRAIQEAKISCVVAINKIDRPNANIERTKQNLAEAGVLLEGWGGQTPWVAISAKTGEGIPDLLDTLLLVADLEQFQGNEKESATGYVLEALVDRRVGVTATLIIKNGSLRTGDWLVVDGQVAKIKRLDNFLGKSIKEATMCAPIRVIGFSEAPMVGSDFQSFRDKKEAEAIALAQKEAAQKPPATTDNEETNNEEVVTFPLLIKADVAGTLEAINMEVQSKTTEKVKIKVINTEVGNITEDDIKRASINPGTVIIGFNVKADKSAADLAERNGINIVSHSIIYKLAEWLEEEVKNRTPKVVTKVPTGSFKVLKIFAVDKNRQVVGGSVTDGLVQKGKEVSVSRRGQEIGAGKISDLELNRVKQPRIESGNQCGAVIDARILLAIGDILTTYDVVEQ